MQTAAVYPSPDAHVLDGSFKVRLNNNMVISIVKGDITKQAPDGKIEGIVNAANGSLNHGGGIASAIVNVGG